MNDKSLYKHMNERGVTLVELMVTVAISGFVIAAIYMSYRAQQKASTVQEQVSEMQQTIRGALSVMVGEIRMAGYDPNNNITDPFIEDANSTKITFRLWNDDDNSTDLISYSFDNINKTLDRKKDAGGYEAIADNIDSVEFYYTLQGVPPTLNPTISQRDLIRSIEISLLARSRNQDSGYTNTNTYTTASAAAATTPSPPNDGFRRRQLITTVRCRNLGL